MNETVLNNFGRKLINDVRDEVININEHIISGKMRSKENMELYEKFQVLPPEIQELFKEFIIEAVDKTIHHFLWMFEQNEEYDIINYTKNKSQYISMRDISDGLCGELYTKYGWIEKFSKYPPSIK